MRYLAILFLPVLVLAACSHQDPWTEAGPGLPTQPADAALPGDRLDMMATLRVESNGCFTLDVGEGDQPWAVWPAGSRQDDDRIILVNGDEVGDGDRLLLRGAFAPAEVLPRWSAPGSLFNAHGTFCEAGERGVILVDQAERDG